MKIEVTGMLIHIDGKFIQFLEGSRGNVVDLYDKIEKDPRHNKVTTILEGNSKERLFPDWTMALKVLDHQEFQKLTGYSDLQDFFAQDHIDNQSHPAKIFLRLFYQKNYRDSVDLG